MILPFSIIERIDFFKSLGPCAISDEILKKLASNRNIYTYCNRPVFSLMYLKDNKLYDIPHSCRLYLFSEDINKPFIIYEIYDNYLRGSYVNDYINEYYYKKYIIEYGYHRDKLISEILDIE